MLGYCVPQCYIKIFCLKNLNLPMAAASTLIVNTHLSIGEPTHILFDPGKEISSKVYDKKFDNTIECLEYVRKNQDKKITVIMILRLLQDQRLFVNELQLLQQVIAIHLMCDNPTYYKPRENIHPKLQSITKITNDIELQLTELMMTKCQEKLDYHERKAKEYTKPGQHALRNMHLREGRKEIQAMGEDLNKRLKYIKKRQHECERTERQFKRQKQDLARKDAQLSQEELISTIERSPKQASD
ncbi:unnamed protein product [Didymodactylos carnosus]|uniref:Uncharacterized protein n=1 Tax=Didymodactylos carnosus TaxID=1234261 RepID=A0A814D737_9BILA|nr:unnamed protein product [Didymodactylos carnosus]CAF0951265.1 unnamed protein product [Didymodactylos carnosus]CAF3660003.1 unnamed protein product [Didymodactylos carnosus]CAF3726925.1 unnamed protein product [Didymodactylos carnosus]